MIVKMVDSSDIIVTREEAVKIEELLLANVEYITIGSNFIKRSAIMGIVEGGYTAPDVADKFSALPAGSCRAQFSIEHEINKRAKLNDRKSSEQNHDGVAWSKLIADRDWREMMRQMLHDESQQWCDYRTADCNCKRGYKPQFERHRI